MRGQRYSRHAKNCWRHFLQTRNSRRRFQVAMASKIYPVFATLTKTLGYTPSVSPFRKWESSWSSPFVCYHPAAHFATGVFMGQPSRLHVPSREAS
jgi:hypothetical protein